MGCRVYHIANIFIVKLVKWVAMLLCSYFLLMTAYEYVDITEFGTGQLQIEKQMLNMGVLKWLL